MKATNSPIWDHPTDAAQKLNHNALGQLARNTAFSTTTYAYDNRTQLAQESSTRGVGYTYNFGYSNGASPTNWKGAARTFNTNNQETTGNAFLYDGAGNTTQMPNGNLATPTTPAPTHKLIYNAQGQLAELRDNNNVVIATYVYRGDGKRAWKELAGEQLIVSINQCQICEITQRSNKVRTLNLWQNLLFGILLLAAMTTGLVLAFVQFVVIPTFNDIENRPARPASRN